MDTINQRLATKHKETAKYNFAIWTAMGLAKKTLNKYYELSDASEVYRIAMSKSENALKLYAAYLRPAVLHPSYKKAYFEHVGWEAEWINIAEGLVRKQFDMKYKDMPLHDGDTDNVDDADDKAEDGKKHGASRAHASVSFLRVHLIFCTIHSLFYD